MDLETLLAPVSDESPAGEDLSYDNERQVIEQAFDVPADSPEQPDWRETIKLIAAQSERTKDVWLAIYLARAGARQGRLETVEAGAQMLAGLFERYWDSVHPTLDELGFQGRKGPCESLTKISEFLGPLKRVVLIEHPRLGVYSGADLERFASEGEGADGYGMFRAAIAEADTADLQAAIDRLDSIRDGIRRADAVLTANAEGDTGTNFQPTYEAIEAIRSALAPYAGIAAEEPESPGADFDSGAVASSGGGGPRIGGRVDSRDDVITALDAIGDYYRRREPSSPILALIQRARSWVNMDFMAVLEDIAPESTTDAKRVLWTKAERDAQSGY
ncbi:type VI secretion system protein TssA [Sphingomonas gilva]|uniref:Type VI secretion system protein TssA n=1 Tax=Sphingomonas gilva TaxID=2305907 RepID=A0A396RTM8_9SPHN|nr:type VI secretion system protein TssA [Sphingomonas gilva]RHW17011.1 type VI secretion system protein TssA [Sphingomonas gilva]